MDEDGYAHFAAIENLASRARVSVKAATEAIECFLAPDPNSSNPDNEGRRIERVPGGYMVLNASAFRDLTNRIVEREQTRLRTRKWRAKKATGDAEPVTSMSQSVTPEYEIESEIALEGKSAEKGNHVYHKDSRSVLFYLREKTGRQFGENDTNLGLISQRLSEPDVSFEGVKKMIDRQVQKWDGTERADYLRPETLFNKTKFDGYYASREAPVINESNKGHTAQRVDKNKGTLNEGTAKLYKGLAK